MLRTWVMIDRKRRATFSEAEDRLKLLRKRIEDDIASGEVANGERNRIRAVLSVFGQHDVVVPIESDSLKGLYELLLRIQLVTDGQGAGAASCIRRTASYISVDRGDADEEWYLEGPSRTHRHGYRFIVGITCKPGTHQSVLARLREKDSVDIADAVLGDFDIIVACRLGRACGLNDVRASLVNLANDVEGIDRTVTMIESSHTTV